jgi:hypothetical protein
MAAITRLCDRVLWLNAGEVVKIGHPDEVVSEYQNTAWSLTGRRLRRGKRGGSHRNECGELLSVMLTSADGREVGAVRRSDEVLVRIGVRLDQPDVTVRLGVHVHKGAMPAFKVTSEDYAVGEAGTYLGIVKLPANLLAETMYSMNIQVVIVNKMGQPFALTAYNALTFRVFDPTSSRRDQIGGLVSPAVEWSFSPHETPEVEAIADGP